MISVVVPTYNRAELLPRAIESVLKQTYIDWELLVVDDGSTDNTEYVAEKYVEQDTRIRYIKQGNSGGAARPKNTGIRKAKGEYVAILDSDDEWMPEKLEKQLALFEQMDGSKLQAVGCDIIVVDSTTGKEAPYHVPGYADPLRQLLQRDYMGPGSCMLYKKSLFDEIGLFDERVKSGQDRDMRIRIAEKYHIEFVPEYLVRYYEGHKNVSSGLDLQEREQDWNYLFEKYRHYYQEDKLLWSQKLQYEGTRYILLGEKRKGRAKFLRALKKDPRNWKSGFLLLFSFLGERVYKAATRYKMAMGVLRKKI